MSHLINASSQRISWFGIRLDGENCPPHRSFGRIRPALPVVCVTRDLEIRPVQVGAIWIGPGSSDVTHRATIVRSVVIGVKVAILGGCVGGRIKHRTLEQAGSCPFDLVHPTQREPFPFGAGLFWGHHTVGCRVDHRSASNRAENQLDLLEASAPTCWGDCLRHPAELSH